MVTLTGTGGVGKTRLAVQAAAEALLDFPDGAWLCELAAASDPDAMLEVVSIALGFTPRQGVTLAQAISEFISAKRLLIVLDNCEHLLDAAAAFAETLLGACPHLRILATSREALDVGGERVVRLRSLAMPDAGASVSEMVNVDAPRLFLDRAESAGVEVSLTEADRPGGRGDLPAPRRDPAGDRAGRSPGGGAQPDRDRGPARRAVPAAHRGRRVAVERHHTLRATVDWSYSLLSPTEQQVFDRLGTFPATFDAAAAEAVAGGEGIAAWDVLDALTSLVAKSMLIADQTAEGSTRYQMLESLRHYARERLDATGLADTSRRLHARHFETVAAEIAAALRSPDQQAASSRVAAELDNFRAAVFWALDSTLDEDGALAIRTIAELAGSIATGDWAGIISWAEQALGRVEDADPRYRGIIVAQASNNAYFRGEFALARRLAADALRLGVVPGCPSPAITFIPAFMYARADDLPALLTTAVAELDRVGASRWDHAHLRASAAAIAALVGNLALAQAEAAQAVELSRHGDFPLYHRCRELRVRSRLVADQTRGRVGHARGEPTRLWPGRTGCRALALVAQLRASRGRIPAAFDALHEAMTIASTNGDRAASAVVVARGIRVLTSAGGGGRGRRSRWHHHQRCPRRTPAPPTSRDRRPRRLARHAQE